MVFGNYEAVNKTVNLPFFLIILFLVVVKKSLNDYNDDNDTVRFASEMNRPLTDLTSSLLEDILEPNPGEISITNLQVLLLLLLVSM